MCKIFTLQMYVKGAYLLTVTFRQVSGKKLKRSKANENFGTPKTVGSVADTADTLPMSPNVPNTQVLAADSQAAPADDSQQQLPDSQPQDSQQQDSQPQDSQSQEPQDMLMANQADDCEGMAGEAGEGEGGEEEGATDDELVDPIVSHELAEQLESQMAQTDLEVEEMFEFILSEDQQENEPLQDKETQVKAKAPPAQQATSEAAASNESGEAPMAGGPPLSPVGVAVPDSDEEEKKEKSSKKDGKGGKDNVGRFKDRN